MSSSTFWHGSKMEEWANAWTRYYTGGKGNYMVAAMEDSGTLQALTFLSQAGRVDPHRVLVLRTVSNYDREAPGVPAAESLQEMVSGNYSAYMPALEAAQIVGDKVVRDLVEHWAERESRIPNARSAENEAQRDRAARVSASTSVPRTISSGAAYSSGRWLYPLRQGMNNMATGAMRAMKRES